MAQWGCLAKLSPLDPATGLRTDVYVSSFGARADADVNGVGGNTWVPCMTRRPAIGVSLWSGDFETAASPSEAAFTLNLAMLQGIYPVAGLVWTGAPVTIYAGHRALAWPWSSLFVGKVSDAGGSYPNLALRCTVDMAPFRANLLGSTYAGTGGAEGGSDIKGKVKPLLIGWCINVEPELIDATNSVYQFSAYGAIEAVTALYEKGSAFGSAIADHADYAALVAATIPPGRWATCLAAGMVRLGAPQAGVITGDVKGHKVGSTTPTKTGAVISALASIAGVSSGLLDSTSLGALDTGKPYTIGLSVTSHVEFYEQAVALALACNWQVGISPTGVFFVSSVSLTGTATITLNAQGRSLPQVVSSDEQGVSPPFWKTTLGASRCWRVHSADEIAYEATLIDKGIYSGATTYREGNTVDVADGSRWVYVNPVAASGNAPPTWPTTSNAYWSNMTPPTDPAAIGAATSGEVAAALALAAAKGKVTVGGALPAVAASNVGDTHIGDDGTFYERVNDGGVLLDGFAVVLDGWRPQLAWTPAATQPLRDVIAQADAAYVSANDAIDQLIGLADDGTLTRNEKITKLIPEAARLEDKWGALSAIAASLSVSTTTAASARTAWLALLAGLSPAWNDATQDTAVSRSAFDAARDAYDAALYALDKDIKAKAATISTWSGVSGTGKPADNATVGAPTGTPVGSITAGDVSSTISSGGGVAANQVATVAIVPNGVNQLAALYTPGAAGFGASTWTTVQSVTLTTTGVTGSFVAIKAGLAFSQSDSTLLIGKLRILRDGSDITGDIDIPVISTTVAGAAFYYSNYVGTICFSDAPGAGSHTYELQIFASQASASGASAKNRYLEAIESKR